jgi:hypothetical protein
VDRKEYDENLKGKLNSVNTPEEISIRTMRYYIENLSFP